MNINQLSDESLFFIFDQYARDQIGKICQVSKRWNFLGKQIKDCQIQSVFKNSFSREDYPLEEEKEILLFHANMWVEVSPYLKKFLIHHFEYFNTLWKNDHNFSYQEHADQSINFDNLDLEDFREMVKVTYDGQVVNHETCSKLLELASRFKSPSLQKLCDSTQAEDISHYKCNEEGFIDLVDLLTEEVILGEKSQKAATHFLDEYLLTSFKKSKKQFLSRLVQLEHCYLHELDFHKAEKGNIDSKWKVILQDKHLEKLSRIAFLKNLNLDYCEQIGDTGLQFIGKLNSLTHLSLADLKITDMGIAPLSNLKSLSTLNLHACKQITGKGMGNFIALSSLDLEFCGNITDDGLSSFANLTSLARLNLGFCSKITDRGLESLRNFTALTSLNLEWCEQIGDRGLSLLPTSLCSLNLMKCEKVTDRGLEFIGQFHSLTSLCLSLCKEVTDRGLSQLLNLPSLSFLRLGGCNFTEAGLLSLANIKSLTYLDFRGPTMNRIKEKTYELLMERRIKIPK